MNRPTKIGLVGAIIAAICCFTPVLVWLFAAVGLAGAVIYLDIVLLPLLAFFIALAAWGLYQSRGSGA